jgi:hypothetical protein
MKAFIRCVLVGFILVTPSLFAQAPVTTPPISEEARKHFVIGTTLFKDAKTAGDFSQVESEFKQAADLAPQWPDARYNLALAKEAAGDYSGAMTDLKLYQQFKLSESEARTVQDKIYALEAKASIVAKKQAEENQIAAAAEEKKRDTHQVLDRLKSIAGGSEYWWYMASVGNWQKGGRQGLNMSEYEAGGSHWWNWGFYRSKYVFRDDKVYLCKYAYHGLAGPSSGKDVFTDLNPDKADFIGTPNGPRIGDIVWEQVPSYDESGKPLNKKQIWVHIDESNGDFTFSGNRPITNPDRSAVYNYWWYGRK